MNAETLIQLCCRAVETVVFQERRKVHFFFFCFWLGLLFCGLSRLGELVSVMERDLM
jgi:hypothetical protein